MTKANARKLSRGQEVYNSATGELARVTWLGCTKDTIFIEGMEPRTGKFVMWTHKKTEKL